MQPDRVVRVESPAGRGSGYVIAPQLVLTSAHATPGVGMAVTLFTAGAAATATGRVVWRGGPGGRDDAALVKIDDPAWHPPEGTDPRWGRLVTNRPGTACQTWGFPAWVQRPERAAETWQPSGTVNPGNRYVGDRYVMAVTDYPPGSANEASPWAGLSGAALFCGDLLAGVVAVDPAGGRHGYLEAVPAYVLLHDPEFRRVLAEHDGSGALDPVETRELAEDEPPVGRSAAGLLRARQQVVGFRGREDLLDRLQAWGQRAGFAAWLLHGPAGQGKTRLAQELARRLGEQRWAWLWLRGDAPADALTVLADAAVPLLVIVDYAETRAGQVTAALRACSRHSGDTPVRMLLLARTAGDWWPQLQAADPHTEALLDGAPAIRLPPLEPDLAGRIDAYRQAVADLARALADMPAHGGPDWTSIAGRLATVAADPGPVSALTVHMKALADLLDAADLASGQVTESGLATVEDRLLWHEHRYWRASAAARGLRPPTLTESALFDALAVAMLLGADDRDAADILLRGLPALADQPRDRRNAVRAWIAHLYPAADARPWGSLQPDRLAERFIGNCLADTPELPDPLVATATAGQVERLLTVYARAAQHAAHGDGLGRQLTALCVRHRDRLALPAIEIATQVEAPGPFIAALQQLAAAPETPLDTLITMADWAPHSSHNLADWAADLEQRLTDEHRRLAADDPDAFLPGLAGSLNNLSLRLGDLGRWGDGLAAIEEAVTIHQELARVRPDVFLPELAMSLNNLSVRLGELGRRQDELAAIEEAVTIRRELARVRPDAFLPDLAGSLSNLSVALGELGRWEDGLAAIVEAVEVDRELARARPDAFLPNLAGSLNNLSVQLANLGQPENGLAAIEEAVEVYRRLAEVDDEAHEPGLANALKNLGSVMSELGQHEQALTVLGEAVDVYRLLVQANPAVFEPDLADTLNNLGWELGQLGRYERARGSIDEAVEIYRRLVLADPARFEPSLANTLDSFAWVRVRAQVELSQALVAAQDAVTLDERLVQQPSAAAYTDLRDHLARLAEVLDALSRGDAAAVVRRKINDLAHEG